MKGSKKKKVVIIVVMLVAIVLLKQVLDKQNKTNGFVLDTVTIDSVTEVVSESGVIKQSGRTDTYSPSTGIVEQVSVENGQVVQTGDELFIVRSTATWQEQQAAYANYLSAQSALNSASATAYSLRSGMYTQWDSFRNIATNDRYETEEGVAKQDERLDADFQTSQDDWLAAEKNYKDQQTAIAAAQASVGSTWQLYQATQDAVVVAQTEGVVANLSIAPGDSVEALNATAVSFGTSSGVPALVITNYDALGVTVSLGQTDIAKVRVGQDVTFSPDAYKDRTYNGQVIRVDSVGNDASGVVKYNVYLVMSDADEKIFSGMTLDADIQTTRLDNVLTVPNAAIKPYEGGKAVRVVGEDHEPEFVPVEIGVKGEERTQILSGIEEGQEIIVSLSNDSLKRSSGLFGG